jgi:NAD(P)-dependent dehydrogenase (short-subunit alcohol dehydrogenase family)
MIKTQTKGSLVSVGSISLLTSAPHHGPYGAAKAGIAAITRTMAFEWMPHGIRANTVSPGGVMTERVMSQIPPDQRAEVLAKSPIKMVTPDQLAGGIVFLLTDLASGISGQNLVVDGGLTTQFAAIGRPPDKK